MSNKKKSEVGIPKSKKHLNGKFKYMRNLLSKKCPNCKGRRGQDILNLSQNTMSQHGGRGGGGGQRTWDKFLSFAVFLAIIPNTVFLVLLVQEVTNRPHHFHIDTIKREDPRLSIIAIMNPKIRPIYP